MNPDEIKIMTKKDPFIKYWGTNYARNLEKKVFNWDHARPLVFLQNKMPYSKKPMVLIAAGPSLDKNIHILKEYQNKCIICCVDVILFKLIENGIKPDYVLNIDPNLELTSGWRDLRGSWYHTENITLIAPTTTHYELLESWGNGIIFYNQTDKPDNHKGVFLKKLTQTTIGFGTLENNFFIGATMLQFSTFFNPSVVILMGYDFAFTDNKIYCDGVVERKAAFLLHYSLNEQNRIDYINLLNTEIMKTSDLVAQLGDEQIKTTRLFRLYKDTLKGLIDKYKMLVVNCTEGGIFTDIPIPPLQIALDIYCKEEFKKYTLDDLAQIKRPRRKRR